MFEQDYIMRQIRQIIAVLMKVLFGVDRETPDIQMLNSIQARKIAGDLLRETDSGNINEAENRLYAMLENRTIDDLLTGIIFYAHLNEKDDAYLETHDFSRTEVRDGMKHLLSAYGLEEMADLFFCE